MFLLDTNEDQKKHIGRELTPLLEVYAPVIPESLDSGDIAFVGRDSDGKLSVEVGLEFKKSPSDVLASMRDGRFIDQLIRMSNEYDTAYWVLVGESFRINPDTDYLMERKKGKWVDSPFSFHYLNATLSRFEASNGHVRVCRDIEHLASYLFSLHRSWTKEERSEEVFVKKRYKLSDWRLLDNPLAEVYERMGGQEDEKGIGIKRAVTLAEKYPSVAELMLAVLSGDLSKERGFGRKTREKIKEVLFGELECRIVAKR